MAPCRPEVSLQKHKLPQPGGVFRSSHRVCGNGCPRGDWGMEGLSVPFHSRISALAKTGAGSFGLHNQCLKAGLRPSLLLMCLKPCPFLPGSPQILICGRSPFHESGADFLACWRLATYKPTASIYLGVNSRTWPAAGSSKATVQDARPRITPSPLKGGGGGGGES